LNLTIATLSFSSFSRLPNLSFQSSFTPPLSFFHSHFSKSLTITSKSDPITHSGSTITTQLSYESNLLDVSHCVFLQISGENAALSFIGKYDSSSETLGKTVITSSTFVSCHGRIAGALSIVRGLIRLSELCFSKCFSSVGLKANSLSIDEATSIQIAYNTIVNSSGLGKETASLKTVEEAVIENTNFSRKADWIE
jgi:hypothetical protein